MGGAAAAMTNGFGWFSLSARNDNVGRDEWADDGNRSNEKLNRGGERRVSGSGMKLMNPSTAR